MDFDDIFIESDTHSHPNARACSHPSYWRDRFAYGHDILREHQCQLLRAGFGCRLKAHLGIVKKFLL